MAQQKDYKVLVMQKVVVPDFAFYKNIGWGILTAKADMEKEKTSK